MIPPRLVLLVENLANIVPLTGPLVIPSMGVVLVAEGSDLIPPGISGLLANGGIGVALIVVVRMFLQSQSDSQKLQMQSQAEAFARFETKLDQIESRHAKDEEERHQQLQAIIDRMLSSQERLTERLAELRSALDALAASTRGHETAIAAMQAKLDEYQRLMGPSQGGPPRGRPARGDPS